MARTLYYRSELNRQEKENYDALVAGMLRYEREIILPHMPIGRKDRAFMAVHKDYPDLFYVDMRTIRYVGFLGNTKAQISYLMSQEDAESMKARIAQTTAAILADYRGSTQLEAEAYMHDSLIRLCTYGSTFQAPMLAHTIAGAFLDRVCVCEGYAKAFKYLADRMNLTALVVDGEALSPRRQMEGHAWNMVEIRGEFYHLDVTFDDLEKDSFCSRGYFNLSDSEIRKDHTPSQEFELPECPTSGRVIPAIQDINQMRQYLREESQKNVTSSEMVLAGRLQGLPLQTVMNQLRREIRSMDYPWYNRIERYLSSKNGDVFGVFWETT